MKKTLTALCVLTLITLACLEPTTLISETPGVSLSAEPTLTNQQPLVTTRLNGLGEIATPARICAREIADTAQNLRDSNDASSRIKWQLLNGDLVQVISQADSDWWLVQFNGRVGYARSIYLMISACE